VTVCSLCKGVQVPLDSLMAISLCYPVRLFYI
jgi:hypothetical protein